MTDVRPELLDLGIRELGRGFRAGEWSSEDATRTALARIAETDGALRSWVFVDAEGALAAAQAADAELAAGQDRGPLHGVPIGVKDIFDVAGWPTRCGSEARIDAPAAAHHATVVATLIDAGAVILGKTVTQEFAAGTISPPARNPWNVARIPGGSSGGSAAAVAAGTCYGALGSDTGGSIRIPAAACGVAGFKPMFGALDTSGVYPLSWSLDTVGPIARSVDDVEIMWDVLRGSENASDQPDEARSTRWRIGVSRPHFFDALQPRVQAQVEAAIERLRAAGFDIVESPWPEAATARACSFLINRIETAAVHEDIVLNAPEAFARYGPDLRLRIAAGRSVPAALYLRALRWRPIVRDSMAKLFAQHRLDALLAPGLPTTALEAERLVVEETGRDETVGAAWTRLTMPFNATGQPVLSVPAGLADDGLPVGLQLAGKPGAERDLLALGRQVADTLTPVPIRPNVDVLKAASREIGGYA